MVLALVVSAGLLGAGGVGAARAEEQTQVQTDVQYGVADGQPLLLDAWVPPANGKDVRAAVVLIHGGNFRTGDKSSFAQEAHILSDHGWVVFNVNYRLNEPAALPAEFDDVQTAVRWVRANAARYQVDPALIGALGEDSGGTLAALLATTGSGSLKTGSRVRTAASWSGLMDLQSMAESLGESWSVPLFGCTVTQCPSAYVAASPVLQLDHSDAPIAIMNSANEQVPVTQVQEISDRLLHEKVVNTVTVYRGTRHALDYRNDAIGTTIVFFDAYFAPHNKAQAGTVAFWLSLVIIVIGGFFVIRRQGATADPLRVK